MYDRPSTSNYHDEFMDQVARNSQMVVELVQLGQRQRALEGFIAGLIERNLVGTRGSAECSLGECQPRWEQLCGRYVHVEPCSLAPGEELLRQTVKTRTDDGVQAASDDQP
jgi:hypothetical protein